MTKLTVQFASRLSQELAHAHHASLELHELTRLGVQDIEAFVRSGGTSQARALPKVPTLGPATPDDDPIRQWQRACVTNSDSVLPLLATLLEERWTAEKTYLENTIQTHSTEPAHFYACRAVAQTVHSLAPWLAHLRPSRRQPAQGQLFEALDRIIPISEAAGQDREGCLAYYIQGLLWLGESDLLWDKAAAYALCIRASELVAQQLQNPENRIQMLTQCFWLAQRAESG